MPRRKEPKEPVPCTLCPSARPGQPVKNAYRGLTNRSACSPFCRSCKDVALGKKDPRAVREAGADRGGRNLAGEDDEDDEAESVDDDEASSSAAIAEERVGGEPHVPPAAATPAAPAPAPARSVPARRLDAGQRHVLRAAGARCARVFVWGAAALRAAVGAPAAEWLGSRARGSLYTYLASAASERST